MQKSKLLVFFPLLELDCLCAPAVHESVVMDLVRWFCGCCILFVNLYHICSVKSLIKSASRCKLRLSRRKRSILERVTRWFVVRRTFSCSQRTRFVDDLSGIFMSFLNVVFSGTSLAHHSLQTWVSLPTYAAFAYTLRRAKTSRRHY